jgi:hypothetical protein
MAGWLRLSSAAALVDVAWRGWMSPWWIALPVVTFIALICQTRRRHPRARRRGCAQSRCTNAGSHVSKIDGQGGGDIGETVSRPRIISTRPDLDLFGPGSLFELLSIARTRAGEDTLASWLLAPADSPEFASGSRLSTISPRVRSARKRYRWQEATYGPRSLRKH